MNPLQSRNPIGASGGGTPGAEGPQGPIGPSGPPGGYVIHTITADTHVESDRSYVVAGPLEIAAGIVLEVDAGGRVMVL